MPYAVSFEEQGAYARFEGQCNYNDILSATIQIWENPNFEYMQYEIFDYLDVKKLTVSEQEAVEIAVIDRVASRSTRRGKIVVLTTSEPILELVECYKSTIEGSKIGFFVTDDMQAARMWLKNDAN